MKENNNDEKTKIDWLNEFRIDIESKYYVIRESAAKNLRNVSIFVGPKKTVKEILPFLEKIAISRNINFSEINVEMIENDIFNCNFLIFIAEIIDFTFIPLVGDHKNISTIFNLLLILASFYDLNVRNAAIKSIKSFFESKKNFIVMKETIKLIKLLSVDSNCIEGQISAAQLTAPFFNFYKSEMKKSISLNTGVYVKNKGSIKKNLTLPKSTLNKSIQCGTVFKEFIKLCVSEFPIVRKTAISNLADLIPHCAEKSLIENVVPLLSVIYNDFFEEIRLKTVDISVALLERILLQNENEIIFSCLATCSTDYSWNMRLNFVKNFKKISFHSKKFPKRSVFFQRFFAFINDEEDEVSLETIKGLSDIIPLDKNIDISIKINFYKSIESIVLSDGEFNKKEVLSEIIDEIYSKENEKKYTENVFYLIQKLMSFKKEKIILNILKGLDLIVPKIGIDFIFDNFYPHILVVINSINWRIRLKLVPILIYMSTQISQKQFEEKFLLLYEILLNDCTDKIRKKTCEFAFKLFQRFGFEWAQKHSFKILKKMKEKNNYLYRMVPIYFVNKYGNELKENVEIIFLDVLIELANDRIINVSEYAFLSIKTYLKNFSNKALESLNDKIVKKNYVTEIKEIFKSFS